MKSLCQKPTFLWVLLLKPIYTFFTRIIKCCCSKKTLILGTFHTVDDKITYTEIEKVVVYKLFGFPVLTHSCKITDEDWNLIIS